MDDMMTTEPLDVIKLPLREAPAISVDVLDTLRRSLGHDSSKQVVERAVFEISDRLVTLEQSLYAGDLEKAAKLSSGLSKLSSQIGLNVFADAADGLAQSIQNQDAVAAAALAGRLLRLGQSSLYHLVEVVGQSG